MTENTEADLLRSAIARRAYELFEQRRYEHGQDVNDWLRAEAELSNSNEVSPAGPVPSAQGETP